MITYLFLFFAFNWSYAGYCKPMRLDGPGQSMEKMPILDQKNIGHCYAATASQMIDAYRFSHGDKNTQIITSPVPLALKAKYIEEAIFANNTSWIQQHPEVIIPPDLVTSFFTSLSSDRFLSTLPDKTYLDYGSVENLFAAFNLNEAGGEIKICDKKTLEKLLNRQEDLGKLIRIWKNSGRNIFQYTVSKQVCAFRSEDFLQTSRAIEKATTETNLPAYLKTLTEEACAKTSLQVKVPKLTSFNGIRQLHAVLSVQNPQPVAVRYCANILRKNLEGRPCVEHISTVIGRRKNAAGKCELLIRNSWGETCDWAADPSKCENGQYWLEEDKLSESDSTYDALLDPLDEQEFKKLTELPSSKEILSKTWKPAMPLEP